MFQKKMFQRIEDEELELALARDAFVCVQVSDSFKETALEALEAMADFEVTVVKNESYSRDEPVYDASAQRQTARSFTVIRGEANWPNLQFKEKVEAYLSKLEPLVAFFSDSLTRLLCARFHVDELSTAQSNTVLRCMRYAGNEPENTVGISAHTDYELFTLIFETAPGLEIRAHRNKSYQRITRSHPYVLMLVGDSLEFISNGLFKAAQHRVPRLSCARSSLVFFQPLSDATLLKPLPEKLKRKRRPRFRDHLPPLFDARTYPPDTRTQLDYIIARDNASKRRRADLSKNKKKPTS